MTLIVLDFRGIYIYMYGCVYVNIYIYFYLFEVNVGKYTMTPMASSGLPFVTVELLPKTLEDSGHTT